MEIPASISAWWAAQQHGSSSLLITLGLVSTVYSANHAFGPSCNPVHSLVLTLSGALTKIVQKF